MQKPSQVAPPALFLVLAVGACSTDTTRPARQRRRTRRRRVRWRSRRATSTAAVGDGTAKLDDGVAGKACRTDGTCAGTNASCVDHAWAASWASAAPQLPAATARATAHRTAIAAAVACARRGASVPAVVRRLVSDDKDCTRSGYYCAAGARSGDHSRCPRAVCPGPRPISSPTASWASPARKDTQCGDGYCADTLGGISVLGQTGGGRPAPGGYCTGACFEDSECGNNGICAALIPNQAGTCYLECGNSL